MNITLITAFFNGFSQILFQDKLWFGLAISLALLIVSPSTWFLAAIGNLVSLAVAYWLGMDKATLESGNATFNGVLIGAALAFLIKQFAQALLLTIMGSILTAFILYFFWKNNLPFLAAPYVVATWFIIFILKYWR